MSLVPQPRYSYHPEIPDSYKPEQEQERLQKQRQTMSDRSRIQEGDTGPSSPVVRHLTTEREQYEHKRKLSNRVSAERSRLRKKAELDELQALVLTLRGENQTLKDELHKLSEEHSKPTSECNSPKEILSTRLSTSQISPQGQNMEESNRVHSFEHQNLTTENVMQKCAAKVDPTEVQDILDEIKHPDKSLTLNLSEMDDMLNDGSFSPSEVDCLGVYHHPLVTVQGYRVKVEMAPTLKLILSKHGDIAANSSLQTLQSRSSFLNFICGIIQELQASIFSEMTLETQKSMRDFVVDLETVQFDITWLGRRLDDIIEAKHHLVNEASLLNDAVNVDKQGIEETQKENEAIRQKLEVNHEKLEAIKDEATPMNERILEVKEKLIFFYERSLLDGLL